jgi:hypothetical protein
MSKKIKKLIKLRKLEKKITKKTESWKKPVKLIKILKKPTGSVQFGFGFISLKPKKPNWTQTEKKNRDKPIQNQAKPVWTGFCPKKPNWIETGFSSVSVFFF